MVDVFISYKQEEREAVQIIASALNDLKVSVWFDTKLRAGGSFDEEIAAALESAKAVLVCWTPAAIQSEWVRGEATEGLQANRLAACFLQPTNLIPPFNLTHAENLCAWAGQADDPAWMKLLERIGELIGRPGLAEYANVMRAGASIQEMKAWAEANGADPLVDNVWSRLALLEGEGAAERLEREKAEARAAGERRKALAEKSRRLARERGLRDPAAERRRFLALVGSVAAIAVLSIGAIVYFVDVQGRDRKLAEANTVESVRAFIHENAWHPIAARAREKYGKLDLDAWRDAESDGSIDALQGYIAEASQGPQGAYLPQAEELLGAAQDVLEVQRILARLDIYEGPLNGAHDQATRDAIKVFRFRWNLPVSGEIDDALKAKLSEAVEWWIHPRLEDLRTENFGPATEADLVRIADALGVEHATMMSFVEVETGVIGGFGADGRMWILFEPHVFSRLTQRRYDATNPNVSYPRWDRTRYPRTQDGRWAQLREAYALDPDAALQSASWGATQILGQNYQRCGFETVGEFVRFMAQSEANQLEATLLGFVRANNAADELQNKDWEGFARIYNGPAQVQRYGQLLRAAYERLSERYEAELKGAAPAEVEQAPASAPVAGAPLYDADVPLPDTGGPDARKAIAALVATLIASLFAAVTLWFRRRV